MGDWKCKAGNRVVSKMDRLRQFSETTTFHGIKDFLRIDYIWARCLWAIFLISCFTMMIYETYALLIQYVDEPTATQVRQKYLASYPYPRMIFCPRQWINASRVADFNLSQPLLIYALSLLRRVTLHPDDKRAVSPHLKWLKRAFDDFLKNHKFRNHLEFFAQIANDPFYVSRCDQCEVRMSQVIASGVCVQFKPFPATSDQLIKLTPTFRYRDVNVSSEHQHLLPFYAGHFDTDSIYVSFRPQYDFFAYDPILLNRNNSYVLRIKPTNYQRLNKPDRRCAPTQKVKSDHYSQVMCYFYCDERFKSACRGCTYLTYDYDEVIKIENDRDPFSEKEKNQSNVKWPDTRPDLPYCSSLLDETPNMDSCGTITDSQFTTCVKTCQPLCNEWVYETTAIPVAQRKLITTHEEADITITLSYQVRYGETFIEEVQTYSWETFVSNIGGQLGLWMGASVVSLLQLLHFLAEFCYYELNPFHRLVKVAPKPSDENENSTEERGCGDKEARGGSIYTTWVDMYEWSTFRSTFEHRNGERTMKRSATVPFHHTPSQNGATSSGPQYL